MLLLLVFWHLHFSPPNPISALIAFILAGSMLAFLTFNFNPAKIFMGDSGALFSGFLLATISITGVMQVATLSILLPFIVLAVPIIDITFASLRRIFKGQSPFVADAEHIHHKLLHAGFSQKKYRSNTNFCRNFGRWTRMFICKSQCDKI